MDIEATYSRMEAAKLSSVHEREAKHNQDPAAFWSVREQLTISLQGQLSQLPPSHSSRCIYRVPERLRKINYEAFTPRLVSIGPLHRGEQQLQAMEEYKLRCLRSFFTRYPNTFDIIDFIVREEAAIRHHYEDQSMLNKLKSEVFCEIILLDSVFMVDLLLKNFLKKNTSRHDMIEPHDEIFGKGDWMKNDLFHDMILIENQLPLFVPRKIYKEYVGALEIGGTPVQKPYFSQLVHKYFEEVGNAPSVETMKACLCETTEQPPRHLVEYLRMAHLSNIKKRHTGREKLKNSATELLKAGVQFEKRAPNCLINIDFNGGKLEIPHVIVNEWTETFFRNLIAFEQCERTSPRYISDYIIFMDGLINTSKDVDILIDKEIIKNSLDDDSEKVSKLFNNLFKEAITERRDFYFADVSGALNIYSRNCWHRWKATWYNWKLTLKRDYFNSPWAIISVIAASVLLVLTVVQTACSIMGL